MPEEFTTYPSNRVLGVVDGDAEADSTIAKLSEMGLGDDMWILTGTAANKALDSGGDNHGWFTSLVRTVQSIGYETEQLKQYEEAALAGAWVIAVKLDDDSSKEAVATVFANHHGRQVRYLGSMGIENLHRNPSAL